MKINFKKLQLPIGLKGLRDGSFKEVNIAEDFADTMYMGTAGIRYKRLSEKIFDSDGEIDLTEEETMLLQQFVNTSEELLLKVCDAVNLVINKEKETK